MKIQISRQTASRGQRSGTRSDAGQLKSKMNMPDIKPSVRREKMFRNADWNVKRW